jgi:hypothetical protein
MTSVLFSVFLLLQTAVPVPGVKVSGEVIREQVQVSQTQVRRLLSETTGAVQYADIATDGALQSGYVVTSFAYAAARVAVAGTAVTGAQLVVPRQVTGRVSVKGDAPVPSSFTLPLMPSGTGTASALPAGANPSPAIRPQIDGTFRLQLPSGEYRVDTPRGLPPGYMVKSMVYDGVDLLRSPLKVGPDNSAELLIELATNGPSPAVSVSGHVTGIPPGQVRRIALREPTGGDLSAALETSIGADGAFTFPNVLPGNYTVYLRLRAQTRVTVGNKDVTGLTVAYPRDILVAGHVIVEGAQAIIPAITIESKGPTGTAESRAARTFVLSLGNGENAISVRNIPEAYRLKSITYGDVDLQKEPLKLDGPAIWDIIVRLAPKD